MQSRGFVWGGEKYSNACSRSTFAPPILNAAIGPGKSCSTPCAWVSTLRIPRRGDLCPAQKTQSSIEWETKDENVAIEKGTLMTILELTVNGKQVSLGIPESRTLAEFLRYDLSLTGTKIGCNEAECGICTVLVDGVPVNSCIYPALRAEGSYITTIEGLEQNGALDPLQDQFIQHGAVQCGFCTPGLIMTARALLNSNPNPDDHDIQHALKDTYCRCTGYTADMRAIHSAAAVERGEQPMAM